MSIIVNPYAIKPNGSEQPRPSPEFIKEHPELLPWYTRVMQSAEHRGVPSVTFRQQQLLFLPEFVREQPSLMPWYARVMESAEHRQASSISFSLIEQREQQQAQTREEPIPDFIKEQPSLLPWYSRTIKSAEHRGASSVTFSFLELPESKEPVLPKTSVGLALKVYPMVSGFLESIGQSFANLGMEELDIIQYNVADPLKALGPKFLSYPISAKEKQIQQEKTDIAVFGLSSIAMIVLPPLIPLGLAGHVTIGLGARTLMASGIGAGVGYVQGGPEGAVMGAVLSGGLYLGSFGLMRIAKKGLEYVTGKIGEKWEPLLWEKQVSGEKLGKLESLYMKSQYPELAESVKPSIESHFQNAPTLEELESRISGAHVNVGIPIEETAINVGAGTQQFLQISEQVSVQHARALVTAKTFAQGQYQSKVISPIMLTTWLGSKYPGTQKADKTIEETVILSYPFEALVIKTPQALGQISIQKTMQEMTLKQVSMPSLDLKTSLLNTQMLREEQIQMPMQSQSLQQIQKQLQRQITQQTHRQLSVPDVKLDFSIRPRRKKDLWEKRYMWEFPVKGPKEAWKAL